MVAFIKLSICLFLAAAVPPVAIGLAAGVSREPLLGVVTGLIGTFAVFWAIRRL